MYGLKEIFKLTD